MFPFHIARPQGCDIQTFYGGGGTVAQNQRVWNKPVGVSHIYMILIGGGGDGDGATGGGSGSVTVWYGAAQNVPNSLIVSPSRGNGNDTTVTARFSNSVAAPTALLTAGGATTISGGNPMSDTPFRVSGFCQSIGGEAGSTGNITPSTTSFLSTGTDGGSSLVTANYGYNNANGGTGNAGSGYFQMQPIIVGVGATSPQNGGIGCGGGSGGGGKGGAGMVLIASW